MPIACGPFAEPLTADSVFDLLASPTRTDPFDDYLRFHAQRIAYLVGLLEPIVNKKGERTGSPVRILDVGPGHLTAAIHHRFGDRVSISTLGWKDDRVTSSDWVHMHFDFDLNDAQDRSKWLKPEPHDVLVVAEVLEHLYTAPTLVLSFLATFLDSDGTLVLQTPNAVALRKRIKLLLGQHPNEMIRETRHNPGHFREYTAQELQGVVVDVALVCEDVRLASYWRQRPGNDATTGSSKGAVTVGRLREKAGALLEDVYPPFRQGLTVIARKP
jgi:trans-aconitate methyltransferase